MKEVSFETTEKIESERVCVREKEKENKLALLSIGLAKPPRQTPPRKRARYHFTISWLEKRAYTIHRSQIAASGVTCWD